MFKRKGFSLIKLFIPILLIACLAFVGCSSGNPDIEENEPTILGQFEGLNAEIEMQILQTYFGTSYTGYEFNPIVRYYGTYDDCVLVTFRGWTFGAGLPNYGIIGGIIFVYPQGRRINVFQDGKLCYLGYAYDNGMITKENLKEINAIDKEPYLEDGSYLSYYLPKRGDERLIGEIDEVDKSLYDDEFIQWLITKQGEE